MRNSAAIVPYQAAHEAGGLFMDSAAIAPYQAAHEAGGLFMGACRPSFVKVTASPAGRESPGRFAPGL